MSNVDTDLRISERAVSKFDMTYTCQKNTGQHHAAHPIAGIGVSPTPAHTARVQCSMGPRDPES